MPKLCFKTRPQGKTVQLVRHTYSPTHKRSQTLTVGTLSTRADPEDYQADLKLTPGSTLDTADHAAIVHWLRQHGSPEAARYRAAQIERIKAELQQEQLAPALAIPKDPFEQAQSALLALKLELPAMTQAIIERGETAWPVLRPNYLALLKTWKGLVKAAQATKIAKQCKRGSAPTEGSIPANQEDPVVD
mgnify:CR=1 FL=1